MKLKKIIGWILLLAGLMIIVWSLYSSYTIFSAKKPAPELFKMEEKGSSPVQEAVSPEDMQQEVEKMVKEQIGEMIPAEFLSKILNLVSWAVLAGILVFGGSQMASVGIKLLKK